MALRAGSVTGFTSTVLALAATAPACSLAVSVGLLVALAGSLVPLVLLGSAVVMAIVVLCFAELNAAQPDCGTCWAWTRRAFGESEGRIVGWVTVAVCVLVLVNLAQVAAVYALTVVGADGLAGSRTAQGLLGCVLLGVMASLAHRGITVAARVQVVLLGLELLALVAVTVRAATATPYLPTGPVAGVGHGVDVGSYVGAFLVAVFLYRGWESAFAVNEESTSPTRTPVVAALTALGLLALLSTALTWALLSYDAFGFLAGVGDDDVLAAFGAALLGSSSGTLLAGAVLVSALAGAQSTIPPAARTLLSMARAGATPAGLASTGRSGSPSVATWAFTVLSATVYVGLLATSDAVLADSVAATAVLVALSHAVTCAAVPFYFRTAARTRPVRRLVLPVLAATCFTAVLVLAGTQLSRVSVLVVLVVLVLAAAASPYRPPRPIARTPTSRLLARRDPR